METLNKTTILNDDDKITPVELFDLILKSKLTFITGERGSGKTFFLRRLKKKLRTLERTENKSISFETLSFSDYIVLDDFHSYKQNYNPSHIKTLIDRNSKIVLSTYDEKVLEELDTRNISLKIECYCTDGKYFIKILS